MRADLGWSYFTAGAMNTVNAAGYLAGALAMPSLMARFGARAEDLRQGTLTVMRAWSIYSPAMAFASSLGIGLVLWFGGSQVLANKMTVGELVQFLLYLGLFYEPIGRLHGLNQMLQSARAASERVFDIMDATEECRMSNVRGFEFSTIHFLLSQFQFCAELLSRFLF